MPETTDHPLAKLRKKCAPYPKGQLVTTDPKAGPLHKPPRPKTPVYVDAGRYARWETLEYLEPVDTRGDAGEEEPQDG